jgi:DNA polymerase V
MKNSILPLFASSVSAGFPSPAQDFIEDKLDIFNRIVSKPASTFLVRAQGDSMIESGIQNGDILVVDKSLEPRNESIVIAYIDGEFTVKRFFKKFDRVVLYPSNSNYKPIIVTDENDFLVWGVVTYVLHSCL